MGRAKCQSLTFASLINHPTVVASPPPVPSLVSAPFSPVMRIAINVNQLGFGAIFLPADPKFSGPINNSTVPVGRDALLTCVVHDLVSFKVAWLRVDTQTILSIQNHVITKNHRIAISHTEHRIWQLKIRDVQESDRGW